MDGKNLIATTLFLSRTDFSQHDCTDAPPFNQLRKEGGKFNLIRNWYNSIIENKLNAIVFHDNLDEGFIEKYSNDNVEFKKHEPKHRKSFNDERFFCYREFLRKNNNVENIFATDAFDVVFHGSPFALINKDADLLVGSEPIRGGSFGGEAWINMKLAECGYKNRRIKTAFNAGIIGGKKEKVLSFFNLLCKELSSMNDDLNANAPCLNFLLNFSYTGKVLTGKPLHNTFGSFKDEGCIIQHK